MRFTGLKFVDLTVQRFIIVFFIFTIVHNGYCTYTLFSPGKEYTYSYSAISSSGVLLPSKASSSWGLNGKLIIQGKTDSVLIQLQSIKMNTWNGKFGEHGEDIDININAEGLLKPFEITYKEGLVENFKTENEPVWITNIKRSIVGIFQLDLLNIEKQAAFHSSEVNHYGKCNVEYIVSSESDNQKLIRKSLNPRTCIGHSHRTWSNVPKMQCSQNDQDPVLKSSERLYKVKSNGPILDILSVNTTGGIYVQPFQSFGEAQFYFARQNLTLISMKDTTNRIFINDLYTKMLQHELPEVDLTQGRGMPDKDTIFKSIGSLLDRLSQRLETPGLDIESHNLHNTTISVLLYYLGMLNRADLSTAYYNISGTSYKEETIRNMFLEALPQVGSKEAALFILDLIKEQKVSDITAIQLLTQLPFHIRKPDVQLLVALQPLLNLLGKISSEVQNTAVLSYGTLIYKTCLLYCPYEMLDDYVRLYLDKFTESTEYEKKMIWLEGLANIQLGRVVEFLEPIASGNNAESRHFRVLAAWASLPSASLRPDIIYPVYWPILVNRTEHLEMRIAALTLLIVSNPTQSNLIVLYWYMKDEPNQHLYNYFYTTLKSMERTTYPCYKHIGNIAAQFTRWLRKPASNKLLMTGNFLFDYKDIYRNFGAMLHGTVIANPVTNVPEVMYITLNNYGSGITTNHVSLYIKAEGFLHSLSTYLDNPTQIRDILDQFKLDKKHTAPVHLELIAKVQQKTVLCLHLNQTNISKALKYLSSLPNNIYHMYQNMEFHVNQQRINIPLTMESIQVTDIGTNVRLAVTASSLFSIRGNFTYSLLGRNNHIILRTSIHGTESIENYNPLIDLWHGAERGQSIHGYLPINITFGLDEKPYITYDTPAENLKMGITAHVKTVTNIRGIKVQSKLKRICPECPILYTVKKLPFSESKTINLFRMEFPELGGQMHTKIFDCDTTIPQLMTDLLFSHQANFQLWPIMQYVLLSAHLVDYFTYVPPKGSCGLTTYVESNKQRSQIKLEYVKNGNYHMISLTNRDFYSSHILHQWNLAALYEATSWLSESFKLKATKIVPGEKIMKLCLEAEREMDWEWDFLSVQPSAPSQLKLNITWGLSDTAKGKCSGSSVMLNFIGETTSQQLQESKEEIWPYAMCRKELKGKNFVPYTDACYEVSRELSTLRKYQIFIEYENLSTNLSIVVPKLKVIYDLIGDINTKYIEKSGQFLISIAFPKQSNQGILQINNDNITIEYDSTFIDYFLTRTRIHKYTDNFLLHTLFSTCIITPDFVQSVHNTTFTFTKYSQVLLLGQCYDDNPRFAITAENIPNGVAVNITDESGTIQTMPYKEGAGIYNSTIYIPVERNFIFQTLGAKRVRLDNKSADIFFTDIMLFMHWTQEQVLLFFPTYVLEFSCGICTASNNNLDNLYQKIY